MIGTLLVAGKVGRSRRSILIKHHVVLSLDFQILMDWIELELTQPSWAKPGGVRDPFDVEI